MLGDQLEQKRLYMYCTHILATGNIKWASFSTLIQLLTTSSRVCSNIFTGSVCSYPIPPTLGQPCTLAGALDCPYEIVIDNQGYAGECCCGRCDLDMTCAPDSTTGSGLWQPMHSTLCPTEGCGSAGKWWRKHDYNNEDKLR